MTYKDLAKEGIFSNSIEKELIYATKNVASNIKNLTQIPKIRRNI